MVASASERSERDEIFAFLRQNHIIIVNSLLVYHILVDTSCASVHNNHDMALIRRVET